MNVKNAKRIKYPGIRPISRQLGVTPSHLWKVLERHRNGRAGLVDEFWAESNRIEAEREQRRTSVARSPR